MENSKEYPTLFVLNCSKCADYSTQSKQTLDVHELVCKGDRPKEKEKKPFICDYKGYESAYKNSQILQSHVDDAYN